MKDYLRETIDIMNKVYGATATDAYSKAQVSIIEKLKAQVEQLQYALSEAKEWIVRLERFQTMVGDYHLKAFIDAWDKVETGHKTTLEREEE